MAVVYPTQVSPLVNGKKSHIAHLPNDGDLFIHTYFTYRILHIYSNNEQKRFLVETKFIRQTRVYKSELHQNGLILVVEYHFNYRET